MFQGTEPIFEKRIKEGQADKTRSYVYAGTTLLARVDGLIGEQSHYDKDSNFINGKPVYFYHADHVGSVKAITNFDIVKDVNDPTKYINQSKVVWNADYLPFGQQYMKNKLDPDFEEDDLGFTGKGYDSDVGLYYFNARWYDADTGRFISEDPVADPDNPNNYSYCANNPLSNTDPTGLYIAADGSEQVGPPERGDSGGGTGGGNPPTGGPGGGGSNTTNNYRKDGTLKNSRTIENNTQTTVYYDKEGNVTRVSVIDNTGMQTITSYREGIPRSVITFNNRGDITGYSRITALINSAPLTDAGRYQYFYQEPLFDEYNSIQGIQAEFANISPLSPFNDLEFLLVSNNIVSTQSTAIVPVEDALGPWGPIFAELVKFVIGPEIISQVMAKLGLTYTITRGVGPAPKYGLPGSVYQKIDNENPNITVSITIYNDQGKPGIRYDYYVGSRRRAHFDETTRTYFYNHKHTFYYNSSGKIEKSKEQVTSLDF